jgi:hypothetical protein
MDNETDHNIRVLSMPIFNEIPYTRSRDRDRDREVSVIFRFYCMSSLLLVFFCILHHITRISKGDSGLGNCYVGSHYPNIVLLAIAILNRRFPHC